MKLDPRTLNIALILIYLACVIFTAFTLFQLRDNLVYASHTLSISDMRAASPVLVKLNLIVGFTLLVGLAVIVFIFKNRSEDVIYVEKKRLKDQTAEGDSGENEEADGQLSTAFLTDILKTEKEEQKIIDKTLNGICKKLEAGIGVIYTFQKSKEKQMLNMKSSYALSLGESQTLSYELGEGLVGQAAKEKKGVIIDDIPEGYIKVVSGLGSASPTHLLIQPIEQGKNIFGVVEIASFTAFDKNHEAFVKKCMTKMVEKLTTKDKATDTKKATKSKAADDKKGTSSKDKTKKA